MIIRRESSGAKSNNLVLVCVITLALLCLGILLYLALRALRVRSFEPRFIPTRFLKQKWKNWIPSSRYGRVPNEPGTAMDQSRPSAIDQLQNTAYRGAGGAEAETAQVSIDRNTSIRSIMTLPAYSPHPKPSEQVIGREGERAGMDVVVEFPETTEEEESRREEEMESLYQIRLARRREVTEREERRRIRREARERGDWQLLEQLNAERRARAGSQGPSNADNTESVTAATLLAEHRSRSRGRRISSVSYADVGHVRHDGSRVRASSQGSDSRPLLDAAAVMGQSGGELPTIHHRTLSGTSIMSQSTVSDIEHSTTPETDIGDSSIPQPPPYEHLDLGEAPPYPDLPQDFSQSTELSRASIVPSIAVENATPPPSAPGTPVSSPRSASSARTSASTSAPR
ncbi:hypothetical protein PRK78_004983 [Emydomyces testavorans]|uniref:Uncharacterized protein n=1 Tax=Emydomyces testavorans TaxID=2070801 RepID=A0AAF0DJM7_9EURO|nr:hypothetical protein PRK78_004983 [Emydomyces testavorans]